MPMSTKKKKYSVRGEPIESATQKANFHVLSRKKTISAYLNKSDNSKYTISAPPVTNTKTSLSACDSSMSRIYTY